MTFPYLHLASPIRTININTQQVYLYILYAILHCD